MSRFLEDYKPSTSSAKSVSQVVSSVKSAVKSAVSDLKTGIVGDTVTTNYPIGDRASTALGGAVSGNATAKDTSKLDNYLNSYTDYGYSGGSSGSGYDVGVTEEAEDPYKALIKMIEDTTKANNEWSAQQAQKQMDFQKMMSDTAHQREVADLKAAGLNPVLSAGGSGASTPVGAMGDTDTSNTRVIAEIALEAIDAMANTAVGVAGGSGYAKAATNDDSFFGKLNKFYTTNKLGHKLIDTGLSAISGIVGSGAKYGLIKAILK